MSESKALATKPANGNGLAVFGGRDDIREIADRLRKMIPGTTRLDESEALTVAQIAVAHGLDPFNGEVWGLKGENGKWYGGMIGIKGLRKSARRQAEDEGGTYWTEPPVRVDPKKYHQAESAVVYEIFLRDTVTMQAYAKSLAALTGAGVPYQDAITMVGKAPVWVGVGIATQDERSKMGLHARAKKRAEADAIKQRYDVNFVGAAYTEGSADLPDDIDATPPGTVEGQYEAISPYVTINQDPEEPQERRPEAQIQAELGFD